MCRSTLLLFALLALGLSGCCVEGYPVLREREVRFDDVPTRVRDAFARGYDPELVEKVEQTTLMSRCTGYPSKFRFHLPGGQTITLDDDGRLARWREGVRDEERRSGGT